LLSSLKKIERRRTNSAAAFTQRRLSYCAFFRNDPAPRAIALTISMPEAFTDFNSTRRMPPHCNLFSVHMLLRQRGNGRTTAMQNRGTAITRAPQMSRLRDTGAL
jgi:hypothetical protein